MFFLAGAEDVVFVLITQDKLHLAWIELGWDTWPVGKFQMLQGLVQIAQIWPTNGRRDLCWAISDRPSLRAHSKLVVTNNLRCRCERNNLVIFKTVLLC